MNYIKLCHPGISRMTAFARDRNLNIRKMTSSCSSYKACKPRFLKVKKAAQRFETMDIDQTVIDEFPRFHFAFLHSILKQKLLFQDSVNYFRYLGCQHVQAIFRQRVFLYEH